VGSVLKTAKGSRSWNAGFARRWPGAAAADSPYLIGLPPALPLKPLAISSCTNMHYANIYAAILRTRPPPELPYDVYTVILDHLHGQRRTLRALAQVSRAMHVEAMPRLYSSIELDSLKKIDAFARAVGNAAEPHVVGARVHTFHLRVDFIANNRTFDQLERIMSLLCNLTELRVRWSTNSNIASSLGSGSHGALLVRCPTTSLQIFEWDCMYMLPVTDFLLRQPQLEELNITDGGMVSSRHKELPPSSLPNLSRIAGEARWLAQVATGRPIVEVTVTRNSLLGITGALISYFYRHNGDADLAAPAELFRVLSLSRGPCRKLSFQGSVMSGFYPADVADLARWLPHLHELGDCYLLDPFTLVRAQACCIVGFVWTTLTFRLRLQMLCSTPLHRLISCNTSALSLTETGMHDISTSTTHARSMARFHHSGALPQSHKAGIRRRFVFL